MKLIAGKYIASYNHSDVGEEIIIISDKYQEGYDKSIIVSESLGYDGSLFRGSHLL